MARNQAIPITKVGDVVHYTAQDGWHYRHACSTEEGGRIFITDYDSEGLLYSDGSTRAYAEMEMNPFGTWHTAKECPNGT